MNSICPRPGGLNEEGFIEDIVASERNVAHRLIEEFMLLANETVAGHLESKGMPALYRIHEPPDPLKVSSSRNHQRVQYSLGAASVRKTDAFPEAGAQDPWHAEERPIAFLMLRPCRRPATTQ